MSARLGWMTKLHWIRLVCYMDFWRRQGLNCSTPRWVVVRHATRRQDAWTSYWKWVTHVGAGNLVTTICLRDERRCEWIYTHRKHYIICICNELKLQRFYMEQGKDKNKLKSFSFLSQGFSKRIRWLFIILLNECTVILSSKTIQIVGLKK